MNTAITISFSIHYKTYFGQEIYVNLDDSTCRKLKWTSGDIWQGTVTIVRPRTIKWCYSVHFEDKIQRNEEIQFPRSYKLDKVHKYFHIFDRWGYLNSSVSPLNFVDKNSKHLKNKNNLNLQKKDILIEPIANVNTPKKSPYITSLFVRVVSPTKLTFNM